MHQAHGSMPNRTVMQLCLNTIAVVSFLILGLFKELFYFELYVCICVWARENVLVTVEAAGTLELDSQESRHPIWGSGN